MALNTASLRSSLNSYLQSVVGRRELTADQINTGVEIIRKIDQVAEGVQAKQQSIQESKVFNDVGKSQASAELGTATISKMTPLARVVRSHEEDIHDTKHALYAVKVPETFGTDASVQYFYGKEIRDQYRGLNQNERDSAFAVAAQTDTDAVLWALLQAPTPLVSAEIMERVLAERAERLNPETVARLKQVEILHEILSGLLDAVRMWLRGLGADPKVIFKELGGAAPTVSPIEQAATHVGQYV